MFSITFQVLPNILGKKMSHTLVKNIPTGTDLKLHSRLDPTRKYPLKRFPIVVCSSLVRGNSGFGLSRGSLARAYCLVGGF